ncbi:hypothetical protein [Aeromicrobium sp. 9AM]|uniref:hypothetical protein n=1 Tax=Aeromicrobium sp. 9AM TaxID=2653126 RepID=UPI0012F3AE1B|nr:hypothetical protein [Aeromicrobium sp. 9AM]VXB81868.1 hypothetical protein AERO9AM_20979 [Aeromicrobium sp. 9AM]
MYGVDATEILTTRSWVWLQDKISGLFNRPKIVAPDGTLLPTTRLAWHFFPPKPKNTTSQ